MRGISGTPTAFADLFAVQGHAIGYDGSPWMGEGRAGPRSRRVPPRLTPRRGTWGRCAASRASREKSALLRAVAGMVPPGAHDLNAHTSVQSLVAVRLIEGWQIILWQNTPASFDGEA